MGRRAKLKFNPAAFDEILGGSEALEMVRSKGEAIAEACNSDSSWGGYFSAATTDGDRARARVWSADNRNDEARDQRLVRNLDAGA